MTGVAGGQVLERAPMDPRIRARRIEVARSAARRRLHRLLQLALLAVVAGGFVGAARSPLLDVDQVRVAGVGATSADAVLEAAAIEPGDQLIDLDLGAAGERIADLPWVDTAQVHRSLRGTVSIRVTERVPAAVVRSADGHVLVDVDGRVLGPAASRPDVAAELVPVAARDVRAESGAWLPDELSAAVVVAERLATDAPGTASLVRGDDLRVRLAVGGVARFGDTSRLDAKLVAVQTVLDQVDLTCLEVIDVRLPGNPVLTRDQSCP